MCNSIEKRGYLWKICFHRRKHFLTLFFRSLSKNFVMTVEFDLYAFISWALFSANLFLMF